MNSFITYNIYINESPKNFFECGLTVTLLTTKTAASRLEPTNHNNVGHSADQQEQRSKAHC